MHHQLRRVTHLGLFGIICVGVSRFNDFDAEVVKLIKVIRSMRDAIALNVQEAKILEDGLLEFGLIRTPDVRALSKFNLKETHSFF